MSRDSSQTPILFYPCVAAVLCSSPIDVLTAPTPDRTATPTTTCSYIAVLMAPRLPSDEGPSALSTVSMCPVRRAALPCRLGIVPGGAPMTVGFPTRRTGPAPIGPRPLPLTGRRSPARASSMAAMIRDSLCLDPRGHIVGRRQNDSGRRTCTVKMSSVLIYSASRPSLLLSDPSSR